MEQLNYKSSRINSQQQPIGENNPQEEHSRESAPETTFLGIRPGEWLLSLLASEGKQSSDNAIEENRRLGEAQVRAYVNIKAVSIDFLFDAIVPRVGFIASNSG